MTKTLKWCIAAVAGVIVLNILLQWVTVRWDLTADQRYTIHRQSIAEIENIDSPATVTLYLQGDMNSSFKRLKESTEFLIEELHRHNRLIRLDASEIEEREYVLLQQRGYSPIVVHERARDGKTEQTTLWPYAEVAYKNKSMVIRLLQQNKGLSGEENLNRSIEGLEFALMEALHTLRKDSVERIAFLEGHGEMGDTQLYDWEQSLRHYFQVDRGVLGTQTDVLDNYKAVVIADPQRAFSETDKYIIDQYIMRGGRVMWLLNGVRFSEDMLTDNGVTPIVGLDLNLNDMLFRYGVRINPALVQDMQCLNIPVDVSSDPQRPQYQPLPWTYAPLLLTNEQSPVTRNVMQVSCTMASLIDLVGGDDGIDKTILLATSNASSLTPTPAEVDLSDLRVDKERFRNAYMPVAVSLEGKFNSYFTHRIVADELKSQRELLVEGESRQIVVAAGSIAGNEWQDGQPLPVGFDRYSKTQFGNRDFLVQSLLWLTDEGDLINLRQRQVALRLINEKKAYANRAAIQWVSLLTPVLLLLLTGVAVTFVRRYKYRQA